MAEPCRTGRLKDQDGQARLLPCGGPSELGQSARRGKDCSSVSTTMVLTQEFGYSRSRSRWDDGVSTPRPGHDYETYNSIKRHCSPEGVAHDNGRRHTSFKTSRTSMPLPLASDDEVSWTTSCSISPSGASLRPVALCCTASLPMKGHHHSTRRRPQISRPSHPTSTPSPAPPQRLCQKKSHSPNSEPNKKSRSLLSDASPRVDQRLSCQHATNRQSEAVHRSRSSIPPQRYSFLAWPLRSATLLLLSYFFILPSLIFSAHAIAYNPVPPPDLDLSSLGRVAITGDFDAISLYTYQQQREGQDQAGIGSNSNSASSNSSQSLITQLPNGDFASVASADGSIKAMCQFIMHDGTFAGVIVGGNFTSLGGVQAQGVAMYGPKADKVTPLPGLTGQVNALLCDQDSNTVYVGGQFFGANSTNAVAWVGSSGWANLPFEGFNGPVNSIIKSPNNTVIFGGEFTGLGNKTASPAKNDTQTVNLSSANLTSSGGSTAAGLNSESNIICNTGNDQGPGHTWLLQDGAPGFWRADLNFGFVPSLLRIRNTHYQGHGTKTFRFTALPLNGIMNFTYTDPATGQDQVCDARCPLSDNPKIPYQDFRFVNTVGMSAFRLDISDWYGAGGGLNGVELFQNDIYAYAEGDLNEPSCAKSQFPSKSSQTGPWKVTPSGQSNSRYLSADYTAASQDLSVTMQPDIQQQGNYSVTVFTPGCLQDNSCDRRGVVNVTGSFTSEPGPGSSVTMQIHQTNNYDKYDEIYRGVIDDSSAGFRASVTIQPLSSQKDPIMIVAQRVGFSLTGDGTNSLNGLYEWNPMSQTVNEDDFSKSTIDTAGSRLDANAVVTSLAPLGNATYFAGSFHDASTGARNILAIGNTADAASSLPNGGLNSPVSAVLPFADLLFVGGNFTNTLNGSINGLNNVAFFDTKAQSWQALGAGVNGAVNTIVQMTVNTSSNNPEPCIALTGSFTQIDAVGPDKAINVAGFAIWVPSHKNWLQNLKTSSQVVTGQLNAMLNVTGSGPLLAGHLSAEDLSANDVVSLMSRPLRLNNFDIGIQPASAGAATRKRAVPPSQQNFTGIATGLFHTNGDLNVTILAGHFTGTASNGSTIENLAFVNNTHGGSLQTSGLPLGLDRNSSFIAVATAGNTLYAGGSISGKINGNGVDGLVVYDLASATFVTAQPPVLGGKTVAVNAITVRPNNANQVFIGGSFETAGSLGCPGVCVYDNGAWSEPGGGLSGTVTTFMWQGNDKLLVGGKNLSVNGNLTSLASYDAIKSVWSSVDGAASALPGAVDILTPASNDASHFWAAGISSNDNSTFLVKYDSDHFTSVNQSILSSSSSSSSSSPIDIRGLQVLNFNKAPKDGTNSGNDLVAQGSTLMLTGRLELPDFGNVSAALFNGTALQPFLLTTRGSGQPGSLAQLFSEKQVTFKDAGKKLAIGFVVLIALACALGAIFLLVVLGILIERYRRKRDGYQQAPVAYFDKSGSNMGRIPPEHLFGDLAHGRQAPTL